MTTRKRKSYHHGDLRKALLDAAVALIARDGVAALTLREVARRAGVSHAAPYHHFEDRAALIAAIAEEGFRALAARMREAMQTAGDDPLARFQATGLAYLKFGLERPAHLRVTFSAEVELKERYPGLLSAANDAFAVLTGAAADALARVGGDPSRATQYAVGGWAQVHGLITLWLDGPLQMGPLEGLDVEALARATTTTLLEGMRAEARAAKNGRSGEVRRTGR